MLACGIPRFEHFVRRRPPLKAPRSHRSLRRLGRDRVSHPLSAVALRSPHAMYKYDEALDHETTGESRNCTWGFRNMTTQDGE